MKIFVFLCLIIFSLRPSSKGQSPTPFRLEEEFSANGIEWRWFEDSLLNKLIYEARARNYDLRHAVRNIEIARSHFRMSRGNFFPSFSISAQYTPEKSSLGIDHSDSYNRIGQLAIEMNWEADIFGGIRKNVKAQKEYYLASQEEYRGVMLSLTAEVATAYIQLRSYQQQLEVAGRNLKSQEKILHLNESRLAAGLSSRLPVAQAKGLWLQTKASLLSIEIAIGEQVNILSVLLAIQPDSLRRIVLLSAVFPHNSAGAINIVPAEAIRNRPDIRAAEREVEALAASVGASKADWWPKFYLNGSIGYGNPYFRNLFEKENLAWQISPSVKWTIFNGREVSEAHKIALLQLDQGISHFNQVMLSALQEIDNALFSYNQSFLQEEVYHQAREQMQLTLEYATELYQKGLTDYQSVLDSQRNVLSYENAFVNAQSTTLLYLIQLYKAGGGMKGEE